MISINKEEAKAIRENFSNIQIIRTVKQKSKRGRYFCEENNSVIKFLNKMRNTFEIKRNG